MESITSPIIDFSYNTSFDNTTPFTILASIESILYENEKITIPDEESTPSGHKAQLVLYDILIPTIGGIIILINLAVVISSGLILKKGQQPRSTYMFLGNLALSDLVTGVAVVFGQLYPINIRDHYICATQIGMIVSSTLTSVYSVGLIAIDRYLYILHGLQYQIWVYPTRVRIFIITTWIIGCIIGFLPLMGWYGDTDNGRVCWFILLAPKELILLTVIIGIIPLLLVIVLYSIILYSALRKIIQLHDADIANSENTTTTPNSGLRIFRGGQPSNSNRPRNSNGSGNLKFPSKWKAIKVVLFTTASFVITWGPYFIASLMYGYCYDKESKRCNNLRILIASPLAILGFFNSLINPIIYAWWHKGFRTFIKRKFEIIKTKRRATQDITATSRSTSTTGHSGIGSRSSSTNNLDNIQFEPDCSNTRL